MFGTCAASPLTPPGALLLALAMAARHARGAAEVHANHMYRGESSAAPRPGNATACAKYEVDPLFSASLDPARYPWRPAVRRSGAGSAVLYGTSHAQRAIWEHQHPADCGRAKFLTLFHWVSGIGSLLHFLGRALGLAMHLGRVLVLWPENYDPPWGTRGMPWYDGKLCPGATSWECWFLPLTHCRPRGEVMAVSLEDLGRFRKGNFTRHYVPEAFQGMLRWCSPLKPDLWFHWWHAQAITYIMRFNRRTRHLLDGLRAERLRVLRRGARRLASADALPPGTIAMHVRHGDKYLERVPPLPFSQYRERAERLAAGDRGMPVLDRIFAEWGRAFPYPPALFSGRRIFISTEDPAVIGQARMLTSARRAGGAPWDIFYCLENRTNVDVETMRQQRGNGKATLESFLNLELALEADAWVCGLSSNWCQLIDELRMTVGAKASSPYLNVVRRGHRRGEGCKPFHRRCYIAW